MLNCSGPVLLELLQYGTNNLFKNQSGYFLLIFFHPVLQAWKRISDQFNKISTHVHALYATASICSDMIFLCDVIFIKQNAAIEEIFHRPSDIFHLTKSNYSNYNLSAQACVTLIIQEKYYNKKWIMINTILTLDTIDVNSFPFYFCRHFLSTSYENAGRCWL